MTVITWHFCKENEIGIDDLFELAGEHRDLVGGQRHGAPILFPSFGVEIADEVDFFAEDFAAVDREDDRAEEACPPFFAGNSNGSVNSTNSTAAILARIQNSCFK